MKNRDYAVISVAVTLALLATVYGCKLNRQEKPEETGESGEGFTETTYDECVDYVVWVDKLNLRAGPSSNTDVVKVLVRGDVIIDEGEEVAEAEDCFWRQVESGGQKGWVADDYILPVPLYEAFREADERGRAGDGTGMRRALEKAIDSYRPRIEEEWAEMDGLRIEDLETDDIWRQYVSPDGGKVIVVGEWGRIDWGGGYPDYGRIGTGVPVLCFENGKGLVDHRRNMEGMDGTWSSDSRYYAYAETPIMEFGYEGKLILVDTPSWDRITVGRLIYSPAAQQFEYEFIDGYLLWIDEDPVKEPGPPPLEKYSGTPLLLGYEFATGREFRLLEADLSTLQSEEAQLEGIWVGKKFYGVKMIPAGPCPTGVERSALYKKYNGKYALAANRSVFMEEMGP